MRILTLKSNKVIITVYVVISLITTFSIYKDYGISTDEVVQRGTAKINMAYVTNKNKSLKTWVDRDYGVVFEAPLVILEEIFNWEKPGKDERDIYAFRHLFTNLFYLIGGVFLFLLIDQLFNSKIYGILALLLYTINPRIYAHSFINSKDIPLMVMFIICFYIFLKFIKKRNFKNILLMSFVSALLINIRILGVLFPVAVIFYLLIFDCIDFKFNLKKTFKDSFLYIIITLIFVYAFWPNLWSNPIDNFLKSFSNMSHFRHNPFELTYGEMIRSTDDNSYFFKWFFVSNPFLYLVYGCFGLALLVVSVVKNKGEFLVNKQTRKIAFLGSFFVITIAIILIKNSVIYNSWRQLFFLYPSFIIFILFFIYFFKEKRIHNFLILFLLVYQVFVLYKQIDIHPYQTVYFNEFISSKKNYRAEQFKLDYWGHSYKEALEKLVSIDKSKEIKVVFSGLIGFQNTKTLPLEDKIRIIRSENLDDADYFISNNYLEAIKIDFKKRIFTIERDNSSILSIYKLR
ncbi:MAG: glycosyltransferase family 39 protein [Polaribacter sp.]|uniref:glycosyltransferase family 39 protein n=1 Tax=Polaribacter sp. TaxID=1920175 RepID=UPI002F35F9F4